jgi:alcohol dehydrogenase (cytochrome c)
MRISIVVLSSLLCAWNLPAQDVTPGRTLFESRCARCHGGDGAGGERGPNIPNRLAARNDQQLSTLIREGIPGTGMPASQVTDPELTTLTAFLRSIQPRVPGRQLVRMTVKTTDGKSLDGVVLGQGFDDLQLRTDDQHIHLLRRVGERFREVTSEKGWPSYNGELGGNRYTTMDQINLKNVSRLGPKWIFTVPNTPRSMQVTPVVVDGVMYVSGTNECYALDAGTGRQLWRFQRPRQQLTGDAGGAANRGVAVAGDRLFMVTSNAHVIALNRFTGE